MRKIYFLAFLFLSIQLLFGQNMSNHRYVVFDITGSMVGKGKTSGDIWNESVDLLKKQLNTFSQGEKVTLYFFGAELTNKGDFVIDASGNTVKSMIDEINKVKKDDAFESWTCIYESLDKVISIFDDQLINTIYLFTDGNQTSDSFHDCGDANSISVLSKFKDVAKPHDYMYILKLTDNFHLENEEEYEAERNIEVIDDAIYNLYVNIRPVNKLIRVNKKSLISAQTFSITGTGVDYLPESLMLKTLNFTLTAAETGNIENTLIEPSTISINKIPYDFNVRTLNNQEAIDKDVFRGKVSYTFDNISGSTEEVIRQENYNIKIIINPNSVEIIYNNTSPTATIKFVD